MKLFSSCLHVSAYMRAYMGMRVVNMQEQQQADVRQPSNENCSGILAAIRRAVGATLQEIQRQVRRCEHCT